MRIKLRIAIILLAIAIPLFATDNDKKITASVADAENDSHPDEKTHQPLISAEGEKITDVEGRSSENVEEATGDKVEETEINENSDVTQGHRNKTVEVRIGEDGEIQTEQRFEVEESSSPKKSGGDSVDNRKVEEETGGHLLDSSHEAKADKTSIHEAMIENSTETGSSPNATADSKKSEEDKILETQHIKDDSINGNLTSDGQVIDAVEKEEADNGEATVLDEDDFKLRGRVAVDYASKSAGALVIEKSGSFKGTSNLLNGDKDKYAIAPCEEKKFVVVSLSEDILVKEIKLANYERFSSTVKEFQVMGSQTMDTWVDLGTYDAEPGNGEQKFELIEPAWARYLKFKFLSHHGVEYYCTYSQIKVHGSTMVQGFHEQWEENEDPSAVTDDEKREEDERSADETPPQNETQSVLSDGSPATDERRLIQNRTNPGAAEVPSISELSMPISLGYILEGRLSSNGSTVDGFRITGDLLKIRSRASSTALMQRKTLEPLEVVTAISLLHRVAQSNGAREYPGRISAFKMSTDLKQTFSILFGQNSMEVDKKISYLLSPVPNRDRQDLQRDNEHQKIQPFNTSEEDRLLDEDKRTNKEGEKRILGADVIDKKENDLNISSDLNAAAPSSPATLQTSTSPNQSIASEDQTERDSLIAKLLVGLPSADCLKDLDFADFKAKAHRKDHVGAGPPSQIGSMEPIFKKLTDEIKALQINLSTQEQFTKVSVACYQRVLLDLMSENEKTRRQHDMRLSRLEDELYSSEAFAWRLLRSMSSMISKLLSLAMGCGATMADCWLEIWSWVFMVFFYALISGLRFTAQLWPPMKRCLSSFSPLYPDIVPPVVDHIDNLLQHFEQRWGLVYFPPFSGITIDVIKFAIFQFLSAALVYVIMTHLRASLTEANAITDITKDEDPGVRSKLPVVSPEKNPRR